MIPENKQAAVAKALQTAFNVSTFDHIQPITKGLSASLVFKISVQGRPYLLRVVDRNDTKDNPNQYFTNMQAAADAGIAPAVLYANVDDKVSITEFIIEQPFQITDARNKMANLIKQVHALPRFAHQVNYISVSEMFRRRFQNYNPFLEQVPKAVFDLYSSIIDIYPQNDPYNTVSSHNDLKPDNIIYDGIRPWLVDWEAAFSNDRYVDLAAMANFVVRNDQDEAEFLRIYFGREANEYERARFFLMSQIVHMFCFTLCMSLVSNQINTKEVEIPEFRAFHDKLWNNEISLDNDEAKQQYACVHMEQLLSNLRSKRLDDSIYTVSQALKEYQS